MSHDLYQLSQNMCSALVHHLSGAELKEGKVVLPAGGAVVECQVTSVQTHPNAALVELQIMLSDPLFGDVPQVDRWAGMGRTPEEAISSGVREWVDVPYVAFKAALEGGPPTSAVTIHGLRCQSFEDSIHLRAAGSALSPLASELKRRSVLTRLVASDLLPILSGERAHTVSCFGGRAGDRQPTWEVYIDGREWPLAQEAFTDFLWPQDTPFASFRQRIILCPDGDVDVIQSGWKGLRATVEGLRATDTELSRFGAAVHGYHMEPRFGPEGLAALSDRGITLPADYQAFLVHAGSAGAGPFYGLLPPDTKSQLDSMVGQFERVDLSGTLCLCHMGCGCFAFLVVGGEAKGEVWVDMRAVGGRLEPKASSFAQWYLDWVDESLLWRWPRVPIESGSCALPRTLSAYLDDMEGQHHHAEQALQTLAPGAISTCASGMEPYFDDGDLIDICPQCELLKRRVDLKREHIVPGVCPKPGRR